MIAEEQVKKIPLFSGLSGAASRHLSEHLTPKTYGKDAVIFGQGSPSGDIYFIAQGEVIIRRSSDAAQRTFKVVAILGAGEFFGEMSFFNAGAYRSAEALANGEVTVYVLAFEEFEKMLKMDAAAGVTLLKSMLIETGHRLRHTTAELVAIFEAGRVIADGGDLKTMAKGILARVRSFFDGNVAALLLIWNEFSEEYSALAQDGPWPADHLKNRQAASDGLLSWIVQTKKPLLSEDWPADARVAGPHKKNWPAFSSLLAAPILEGKTVFGVMILGHLEKTGHFAPSDRQALGGVCNLMSTALQNAALHQEAELKDRLHKAKGFGSLNT